MTKTFSTMLPLGSQAHSFSLPDVLSGSQINLNKFSAYSKGTLIMFICNHCPYVKHINEELVRLANDYLPKEIVFLAINSNDTITYPDDSPENMKKIALQLAYPFPYLFDETQEVAKVYQAACTPDFYLFDKKQQLVYRGQFDDSRPGNSVAVTGSSVRAALDSLLSGIKITMEQKPSLGCNIKWKK